MSTFFSMEIKMKNLQELIDKHGTKALNFERYLYSLAEHFSADYAGGLWKSKTDEKDGFFLLLEGNSTFTIRNTINYYDSGSMDSKTFSLAIFALAVNTAGTQARNNEDKVLSDDLFDLFFYCQNNAMKILGDEKKHAQYHWFLD